MLEIFDSNDSNSENQIIETDYLLAIPGMKEKLLEGLQTPFEDCLDESLVNYPSPKGDGLLRS